VDEEPWRPLGYSRSLWLVGMLWVLAVIIIGVWPT
jgi:hypothetical protein